MIVRTLLGLWMSLVLVAIFVATPTVEGLGETSRIVFFHVPLAWISVLALFWSMIQSLLYLRDRTLERDASAEAAAQLGLLFCLLATATGMVFAKSTWGAYWNWDPRETTILALLLVYLAYLALRLAIEDRERRATYAAVYALLAFLTVPFLVFVIPRLYATLHPSPIIPPQGWPDLDPALGAVLAAALIAFTGLYAWMQHLARRVLLAVAHSEEV